MRPKRTTGSLSEGQTSDFSGKWGKLIKTPFSGHIYMSDLLHNWEKKSAARQKDYRRLLQRADKNKVLPLLPDLHEEAFEKIDCLQCANCCKSYSPRFKTPDIKRIARHLRMRESEFIDTYLRLD